MVPMIWEPQGGIIVRTGFCIHHCRILCMYYYIIGLHIIQLYYYFLQYRHQGDYMKLSTKLRKWLFILSITAIIITAITLVSPRVYIIAKTNADYSRDKTPELYVSPINMDVKYNDAEPDISCYGLEFKSPWGKSIGIIPSSRLTAYKFKDGKGLAIRSKSETSVVKEALKNLSQQKRDTLSKFLGEQALKSDFEYSKSILKYTPYDIKFMETMKNNKNIYGLLATKHSLMLLLGESQDGIYVFDTGKVKGFQYGKPSVSAAVNLRIFDESKDYFITLNKNITQTEIDSIISTMQITK